jgi:8-oxo-dGTP diphosphatase
MPKAGKHGGDYSLTLLFLHLRKTPVPTNLPNGIKSKRHNRPAVTVDIIIFSLVEDDLNVLLIKRKFAPYSGMWAIPGGFLERGESLEQAAVRELAEETGITNVHIEQLYAFGDPGRDPRMQVVTITYFTLVPIDSVPHRPGDDAAETRWFSVLQLPQLAFDHQQILDYAVKNLRSRVENDSIRLRLLPDFFTLTELQNAHEVILGSPLDKRNFRRKILASGIIKETGKRKKSAEGRPAMLYQYQKEFNNSCYAPI